jgi:hypothetical protein
MSYQPQLYPVSVQGVVIRDSRDRPDSVSSVPNTTYTITSASALVTKVVDPGGNTRSATYTPLDDVATATNGLTGKTANTYGANSGESLTSSASPTGATASLAYGNSDTGTNPTASFQSSSAKDAQGNATAYTYDGPGNLAQSIPPPAPSPPRTPAPT